MTSDKKWREPWTFKVGKHTVIVDYEMVPFLALYTWHITENHGNFYARTNMVINGKQRPVMMHRLLKGMKLKIVDHANGNSLDNRLDNLRFCTNRQNSANSFRPNKTGYRGVYKPKNSSNYSFQITLKTGERYSKHGFKTAKEAAKAYDEKAREVHGEYGRYNFET